MPKPARATASKMTISGLLSAHAMTNDREMALAVGGDEFDTKPVRFDGLLKKIVQTPGLLVILTERNAGYRQIFTDGRPLPEDPTPSWNGYSSAKWEGDTLVVQSNGFRDGIWLDASGSPMTEAAKMTERFRRPRNGTLEIEITVDDAKAYTKPWTVKPTQPLVGDTELLDYICLENERDSRHFVAK